MLGIMALNPDRGHPPVGAGLQELSRMVGPVALKGEHRLPVAAPLEGLFPAGALPRGSIVTVAGSTSLAVSLLVAASQGGSWCAAVGLPSLGVVAAAELGVCLDRLALVPAPGPQWTTVAGALVDAVDVVVVRPPGGLRAADARRLATRVRERGAVLVPVGPWPEGAQLRLSVTSAQWDGLGRGHGHLRARRLGVVAQGRGVAARERRVELWLPAPGGGLAPAPAAAEVGRGAPVAVAG
jgi:hypothetical protein